MNLDELQSVRDRERQTDKLQQLRETFYEDTGEFIQQLRKQRERAAERADDPFDAPEVSRLSDEIDTAEQTVEAIYEKRVGKIVKAASFAAADLPAESDGMTAEEKELFETLVDDIKANRQHVMDVLDGGSGGPPVDTSGERAPDAAGTDPQAGEPASAGDRGQSPAAEGGPAPDAGRTADPEPADERGAADSGVSAADVMGDGPPTGESAGDSHDRSSQAEQTPPDAVEAEPEVRNDGGAAAESNATAGVDRETVRITEDVGDFLGFDEREYDLSENDVVTLPATNVEPLVSRDAAERLD